MNELGTTNELLVDKMLNLILRGFGKKSWYFSDLVPTYLGTYIARQSFMYVSLLPPYFTLALSQQGNVRNVMFALSYWRRRDAPTQTVM